MTDTINIWNGNGSQTEFTFSLTNYNSFYMTLNGYVRDELTYVEDPTYSWALDSSGTQAVLSKPLEVGKQFVLEVVIKKQPEVFYQNATEVLNDISLNKNILQALYSAQAALDHRGNPRIQAEDMNNQNIMNLKDGTEDHHAVTVKQLNSAVGDIDEFVQRAETAADESELYRDESLAASIDSANSAAAALVSEQAATAAAARANTMYKGIWAIDYPGGANTGYSIGDTVLYQNNQYKSIVDNNTSVPTSALDTEWEFYLPGAVGSAESAANFFQTYLQGDGVTTDFDLTAINPTWTPKIDNNVFLVLVNGETDLDWTIVVNQDGHSILRFLTAPVESNDTNKKNIFVVGGSPVISDIPRDPETYLYVNDTGTIINKAVPNDIILPSKYNAYYGGSFDASKQFIVQSTPNYNYTTYTYTMDGTDALIKTGVNFTGDEFILDIPFTATSFNGFAGIVSQQTETLGLAILMENGVSKLYMSSNGSAWDISNGVNGSHTYVANQAYIMRLEKDTPNSQWFLKYSVDNGQTFNIDTTISSALQMNTSSSNIIIGANVTGADSYLPGDYRLDKMSFIVDGVQYIRPQDVPYELGVIEIDGTFRSESNLVNLQANQLRLPLTGVTAYSKWYLFIGKDSLDTTVLEWSTDSQGSSLVNIVGDKRRIGDEKDIQFLTGGTGELAYFEKQYDTWVMDLWSGNSTMLLNNTYPLNDSMYNYGTVQCLVVSGDNNQDYPGTIMRPKYMPTPNARIFNTEVAWANAYIRHGNQLIITGVGTGSPRLSKVLGIK